MDTVLKPRVLRFPLTLKDSEGNCKFISGRITIALRTNPANIVLTTRPIYTVLRNRVIHCDGPPESRPVWSGRDI